MTIFILQLPQVPLLQGIKGSSQPACNFLCHQSLWLGLQNPQRHSFKTLPLVVVFVKTTSDKQNVGDGCCNLLLYKDSTQIFQRCQPLQTPQTLPRSEPEKQSLNLTRFLTYWDQKCVNLEYDWKPHFSAPESTSFSAFGSPSENFVFLELQLW